MAKKTSNKYGKPVPAEKLDAAGKKAGKSQRPKVSTTIKNLNRNR